MKRFFRALWWLGLAALWYVALETLRRFGGRRAVEEVELLGEAPVELPPEAAEGPPEEAAGTGAAEAPTAFCLRCRAHRPLVDWQIAEKGGRRRLVGRCSVCGARVSRFVAADASP